MTTKNKPNRLANEKSPYLLQHAHNPVDWYPWSEEAFENARSENKPVFLSIGYSTCHWCHVMERESFEDEEVAELLNRHYVAVKVDREERPDIDHLYMTVCQAISGQGGWPLTVIMTPDKQPFFAGTYYPKTSRYGRPGMMDILPQIAEKWNKNPENVAGIGQQIAEAVGKRMRTDWSGDVTEEILDTAFEQYEQMFDPNDGGFGSAPKFPASHNLSYLLRHYNRTGDKKALEMVETTLESMYRGGMYDHIGFGFARYSTDEQWLVPHFEKMLYDNALLAWTYLEAWQVTGNDLYRTVADQIFTYVLRDMTHPEGGFYSAEDADSEGVEGKFYVWAPEEVREVLGKEDGQWFCELYDISPQGNFEGKSIPNLIGVRESDYADFAERADVSVESFRERMEECRKKLFAHREKRVHPGKDDKILTAWNGLMIMAMAKGAKVLGNSEYLRAAERAARFILARLRREDGRLLARYRDGEAAYPAYVDDYAFMVWGLMELYEASFDVTYLEQALELNRQMLDLFWDEENGGLFFYGRDGEQLFTRNKETYDGAMPSGNSVAALNLQRLARLTDGSELRKRAEEQIRAFSGIVRQQPTGHGMFLIALDEFFTPGSEMVIAGDPEESRTQEMTRRVRQTYAPHAIILGVSGRDEADERIFRMAPAAKGKTAQEGEPAVYICRNFACEAPVTDVEELEKALTRAAGSVV